MPTKSPARKRATKKGSATISADETNVQFIEPNDGETCPPDLSALSQFEEIEETTTEEDQIQSIIEDLGSGGKVTLQRRGPNDSGMALCDTLDLDEFSIDHVMKKWGGGRYVARFKTATNQIKKTISFKIDEAIRGTATHPASQGSDNSAALITAIDRIGPTAAPDNSELMFKMMELQSSKSDQMVTLMIQQSQQNMTLLVEAMKSNNVPAPAPGNEAAILTALAPAISAAISGGKSENSDILGQVEKMQALKELLNGDEEKGMMSKIVELLGEGVSSYMQSKNPKPPEKQIEQGNSEVTEEQKAIMSLETLKAQFVKHLPKLIKKAEAGSDPLKMAELIADFASDAEVQVLIPLLLREDWKNIIFGNDQGVQKHLTYFENLRIGILKSLLPESEFARLVAGNKDDDQNDPEDFSDQVEIDSI